jgi:hypothetical protein
LVVREEGEEGTGTGRVVSFVKWLVHRPGRDDEGDMKKKKEKKEDEEEWPDVARKEYLDPYAELTGRVREGVLGRGTAYYREFYFMSLCLMMFARFCVGVKRRGVI